MPEKTTKRKNYVSVLFFLLLLFTLISFCFLGTTFARYTSGGSGTGTVTVAKWSITAENAETTETTTFGKLSPSKEAYSADTTRANTSELFLIMTITNESDVDALVTAAASSSVDTVNLRTGSDYSLAEGATSYTSTEDTTGYAVADVKGLFTITLYASASELTAANDSDKLTDSGIVASATGGKVYIYATVTWTTNDTNSTNADTYGDALDTFVGENVESVSWDITYTAVQNSELPATNP